MPRGKRWFLKVQRLLHGSPSLFATGYQSTCHRTHSLSCFSLFSSDLIELFLNWTGIFWVQKVELQLHKFLQEFVSLKRKLQIDVFFFPLHPEAQKGSLEFFVPCKALAKRQTSGTYCPEKKFKASVAQVFRFSDCKEDSIELKYTDTTASGLLQKDKCSLQLSLSRWLVCAF